MRLASSEIAGTAILLALVGAGVGAQPATAQTAEPPPSLDGHGLNAAPGFTFTHPSSCQPGETASVSATGSASGPFSGYRGTFTADGTVTVGEFLYHYDLTHHGSIELRFSIDSTEGFRAGYRIEGTIRGSTRIACRPGQFGYDPCCATYSARIITPDGHVYRDEGDAQVVITIGPWWDPTYRSLSAAFGPSGPVTLIPACSDAIDNDGDGAVDVGADRGCESSDDGTEAPDPPRDTTPPALTVPGTVRVEATSPAGAPADFVVTARDDHDAAPAVACDRASGSVFPLGTTRVVCSASDAAGNAATASFDVVVVDTTTPELHLPADVTATATGPEGVSVDYAVSASDVAAASPTAAFDPPTGSVFPLGTTTVACTATDSAGNRAAGTFRVTVVCPEPKNDPHGNKGREAEALQVQEGQGQRRRLVRAPGRGASSVLASRRERAPSARRARSR